jgi:hypothetical protein
MIGASPGRFGCSGECNGKWNLQKGGGWEAVVLKNVIHDRDKWK